MRVPRSYIGKMIEATWRDPYTAMISCQPEQIPKGIAGLAVRKERGIIQDISDGVVLINHSDGHSPTMPDVARADVDYQLTWVQETLIEEIELFAPVPKNEQDPAQ